MIQRKPNQGVLDSVLAWVNGDSSDNDVVRLACDLLIPRKGDLYIVYVIEVHRSMHLDSEIETATLEGERILTKVEEIAIPYKCNVHAEMLQSRTAGIAVVQEAAEKNVGAVVIGSDYNKDYGLFSLGKTIPFILKNAPCKVILWRNEK